MLLLILTVLWTSMTYMADEYCSVIEWDDVQEHMVYKSYMHGSVHRLANRGMPYH